MRIGVSSRGTWWLSMGPVGWVIWLAAMLAAWVVIAAAWALWAIVAVPVAAVATLTRHDGLAGDMTRSLKWFR